MKNIFLSLFLLPMLTISPLAEVERILAVVNDDIILSGDVEDTLRIELIRQNVDPSTFSPEEYEIEKKKVLSLLIDDLLIEQEIRDKLSEDREEAINHRVEELTNETMNELRDQYPTPSAIARLEQQRGLSWSEIRRLQKQRIYKEYIRLYVLPSFIPRKITPPTQEEIENFKQEHPEIELEEKARIAHILLYVPENASSAEEAQIRLQAESLAKRARSGESFAELAKQYSDQTTTKDRGGVLPTFQRGEYFEEFNVVFDMKEGEISDPIRTPIGYHIIKVMNLQSIEDLVIQEKGREVTREWLKSLRDKAKIKIRQEEK